MSLRLYLSKMTWLGYHIWKWTMTFTSCIFPGHPPLRLHFVNYWINRRLHFLFFLQHWLKIQHHHHYSICHQVRHSSYWTKPWADSWSAQILPQYLNLKSLRVQTHLNHHSIHFCSHLLHHHSQHFHFLHLTSQFLK